ncbi:NAD(P)/FAD-dependent oxidoreductase [Desulfoplanes formicivorans]|uniref:FAD-dependent protein C-terminal domain-containing protein n=1 Tax=Desulfoplanes formicivorans TaxID=1592317 RepID=A0A194AIE5_9BACT|nr:hypothetical protein [Desulfoplanes formicivorans]GAU08529.1 hypothetical protein DPF_1240 [Desulfoplanes formicivorans]
MTFLRITQIKLPIDHTQEDLHRAVAQRLGISPCGIRTMQVRRQSIDARKRGMVFFVYTLDVELASGTTPSGSCPYTLSPHLEYTPPPRVVKPPSPRPVVVGAGPCGLFAALILARAGYCPLVLDRGKPVDLRTRDVQRFWETGILDPESNVQFGEGGAGTFSDGKLNTGIKDRNNRCRKVLTEFVAAGAPEDILYVSHPHIGTDLLVSVVQNIRETITALGGEVRFQAQVTGLRLQNGRLCGITINDHEEMDVRHLVMAIGHSARDTFALLKDAGVALAQKPFSLGCRIEHPQSLVDRALYGRDAGHPRLGPAPYKLVHHARGGRSAYTFCMCPGGQVIAAASGPGEVVTNGMSLRARSGKNANAALLVGIQTSDLQGDDPLAGVAFQRQWETRAFELGGADFHAPAQLVGDFLQGVGSRVLGEVLPSYTPGVRLCDLRSCLPEYVRATMQEAIVALDGKLKGFALPDAVLTGVETRSSSPVRILRDERLESVSVKGLYPAGEGAGYAGGITSSAVDGIRVAEMVARKLNHAQNH